MNPERLASRCLSSAEPLSSRFLRLWLFVQPLLPNLGPITLAIATSSGMTHTRQLLALAIPFVSLVPVEILANFHQGKLYQYFMPISTDKSSYGQSAIVAVAVTSASAAGGVTSATVAGGISVTGTGTTGGGGAASPSSGEEVTTARSAVASSASHTNSAASPSGTSTSNGASGSNRFVTYWDKWVPPIKTIEKYSY